MNPLFPSLDAIRGNNNPWREFSLMQRALDRVFDGGFTAPTTWKTPSGLPAAFNPACEVSETKNQYVCKFDLPGISKDQIKVELEDNRLTVSGERMEESKSDRDKDNKGEGKKQHFTEVYYGSFARSFTLPTPVNPERAQASFENGVLTITLDKTTGAQTRQISVR